MPGNRTGYDSTSVPDIPKIAKLILAYADGDYAHTLADAKKRLPKGTVWSISGHGEAHANFYDIENGLLTIARGIACVKGNVARGEFAGIYCNESTWDSVKKAVSAAGLTGKVHYWIAWEQDSGSSTIPAGAVGRQYLLSPGRSPGHFDVSSFLPYIEGLDPKPKPPKPRGLPLHLRTVVILAHRLLVRFDKKNHAPLSKTADERLSRLEAASKSARKVK